MTRQRETPTEPAEIYPTYRESPGWPPEPVYDTDPAPVLSALEPAMVVLGSPSFPLHVRGSGFADGHVIVFAGHDEPTTVVAADDVTTGVNMDVWSGADVVPVLVRTTSGAASNSLPFTFTAAARR